MKTHRLIHNGTKVIQLVALPCVTATPHTVFEGTEAECQAEIDRLNLNTDNLL